MSAFLRTLTTALIVVTFVPPCIAGTIQQAAEDLPGDVLAVFVVGDLKKTDETYRAALQAMGVADLVPDAERYPLRTLKEKLPGQSGFDDSGSIALAILRADNLPALMNSTVVLLPASDSTTLLGSLAGPDSKPDEHGIRAVQLFGRTMYGIAGARHLALAKTAEVARRAVKGKQSLLHRLTSQEIDALDDLDAIVWIDATALLTLFKPQIDGLVSWGLMMQMGAGEVGEEEARLSKKQIDTVVEGLATLMIGVSLAEKGVGLRVVVSAKPGSDMARQTQHTIAERPLLRGLPRRNYLAAFGQEIHPDALRAALPGLIEPLFAELKKASPVDPASIDATKKEFTQFLETLRGVRGCFDVLEAGTHGRFAGTLTLDVTDSKEWIALAEKLGTRFGEFPIPEFDEEWEEDGEATDDDTGADETDEESAPDEEEDDESEKEPMLLRDWMKWKPQTEQIEGVNVSHLFVDVLGDGDLDAEEMEVTKAILGTEAVTVRLAAVDPKTIAITCGGGADPMARVIRTHRANRSPLDEHDEWARYAAQLPARRAGIFVFAVDRTVNFLHGITDEVDGEEPFPFWMPRVDAPLMFSITGGDGWSRHDFYAPMPLLAGLTEGIRAMDFSESEDEPTLDELDGDE